MHKNPPTSICNSKIFLGSLTLAMKSKERERGIVLDCRNENLATLYCQACQISKILATKPFTINQFSSFQNALKLTYGNVEFKKFPGEDPRTPAPRGGRGRAGRVEEGWDEEGKGRERR
jgi:hypothetical protein